MGTGTEHNEFGRRKLWARAGGVAALTAVGTAVMARPAHADGGDDVADAVIPVTRAELRATSSPLTSSTYYLTDPGAEGLFLVDSQDSTTADNTGTVLVTEHGERLKRVHEGVISVTWFGAVGDGSGSTAAPNVAAIQAAFDHAGQIAGESVNDRPRPIVHFPAAEGYRTNDTVTVPSRVNVSMDSSIHFAGGTDRPALVVGEPGVANHRVQLELHVERVPASARDWSDENHVGIVLRNLTTSWVTIIQSINFAVGVRCIGEGAGFAYNEIHLGQLTNNRIGVDLTNRSVDGRRGWCNENLFLAGRFSATSSGPAGQGRIGVRITSQDGTYVNNNANIFSKPSFELMGPQAEPEEALPILIEHGTQNNFHDARNEGNTGNVIARLLNESQGNSFSTGFGYAFLDDQTVFPTSTGLTRRRAMSDQNWTGFSTGSLAARACYYDGDSLVQVPGLSFATADSADILPAGDCTLSPDQLSFDVGEDAIGIFVDTRSVRSVVVKRDQGTRRGRVYVACYDEDGDQITTAPKEGEALVRSSSEYIFEWREDLFGGCYETRAHFSDDFSVWVSASVHRIRLLFGPGEQGLDLRSFAVVPTGHFSATVSSGLSQVGDGNNVALRPPTTGSWARGTVLTNAQPETVKGRAASWIVHGWQKITDGDTNVVGTDWIELKSYTQTPFDR